MKEETLQTIELNNHSDSSFEKIDLDELSQCSLVEISPPFEVLTPELPRRGSDVNSFGNSEGSGESMTSTEKSTQVSKVLSAEDFSEVIQILDKRPESEPKVTVIQEKEVEKGLVPIHTKRLGAKKKKTKREILIERREKKLLQNRLSAQQSRERKKKHYEQLEKNNQKLLEENAALKKKIHDQDQLIKRLQSSKFQYSLSEVSNPNKRKLDFMEYTDFSLLDPATSESDEDSEKIENPRVKAKLKAAVCGMFCALALFSLPGNDVPISHPDSNEVSTAEEAELVTFDYSYRQLESINHSLIEQLGASSTILPRVFDSDANATTDRAMSQVSKVGKRRLPTSGQSYDDASLQHRAVWEVKFTQELNKLRTLLEKKHLSLSNKQTGVVIYRGLEQVQKLKEISNDGVRRFRSSKFLLGNPRVDIDNDPVLMIRDHQQLWKNPYSTALVKLKALETSLSNAIAQLAYNLRKDVEMIQVPRVTEGHSVIVCPEAFGIINNMTSSELHSEDSENLVDRESQVSDTKPKQSKKETVVKPLLPRPSLTLFFPSSIISPQESSKEQKGWNLGSLKCQVEEMTQFSSISKF
eukprot:augustus_masked-scaffold_20-processed-gene-3.29-mRNA-1 protein AED:1.00 eAED:1.00 QI:0/-1/0/0/-1/1/1/0/582